MSTAPPYSSTAAGWDANFFVEMKKALIIGGTGLLGRGVADVLLQEGWNVSILTRGNQPLPRGLAKCHHIKADRTQRKALFNACQGLRSDMVVDCAAYDQTDAEGAVEAFKDKVNHYWFISSDFVYDADASARFPLRENAKTQNCLPYSVGKLAAEAFLLEAAEKHSFPVTILRPPHILGAGRPAGCDPAAGGRDRKLADRIRGGEAIPLIEGGLHLIQPIWSQEIGRCVNQLYGDEHSFGQLYNIAGKECVTTLEYYQTIAGLVDSKLKIQTIQPNDYLKKYPEKSHLLRHRIYDTGSLSKLGFTPELDLRDALKETILNS